MAFGGGNFRDYNKGMPGTYTNTITIGAPVARVTRGITAGGLKLDWGPDDQIFKITKAEFGDHPVDVTGYPEADDHNILIREIFKHADELVLYKLNREGGAKATHADIGEALYKGTAGNKIVVTAYPNINDESQPDISSYFDGILKDVQTVDISTPEVAKLTKGTETDGGDKPEDLGEATVTPTYEANKVTIKWASVTED